MLRKFFQFDVNQFVSTYFTDPKAVKKLIWLALLCRVLLFITDGHNSDFDFFEHWADRIVHSGFTTIYSIQVDRFECDYPPLYLYVVGFFGHVFNLFNLPIHTQLFDTFLKLFNLLAEAFFLWRFYKISGNRVFLFVMLFSPVTILNAYGWGQIDILYSILVFTSVWLILREQLYGAAVFLGLSLALKTQTLLFLPIIGLLFLKARAGIATKVGSFLLMGLVYLVPNLPFILYAPNPMDSINPHITAAGRYNFIAVNSFNLYWALWADFALKLKLKFPPNDVLVFGLISRKLLAYGLFSIIYAWVLWMIMKLRNTELIMQLIAFFCFSFFMFLPEMHERYLFPFFIFSAFVVSYDKKEYPFFIIISLLHVMNLLWGWGEQKYVKQQWMFESTRLIALATFVTWCFYAAHTFRKIKQASSKPGH